MLRFFHGGVPFHGVIGSVLPADGDDPPLWHVTYDDDSEEDLDEEEARAAARSFSYASRLADAAPAATADAPSPEPRPPAGGGGGGGGDAPECIACGSCGGGGPDNRLLRCAGCGGVAHQACVAASDSDATGGSWRCLTCLSDGAGRRVRRATSLPVARYQVSSLALRAAELGDVRLRAGHRATSGNCGHADADRMGSSLRIRQQALAAAGRTVGEAVALTGLPRSRLVQLHLRGWIATDAAGERAPRGAVGRRRRTGVGSLPPLLVEAAPAPPGPRRNPPRGRSGSV